MKLTGCITAAFLALGTSAGFAQESSNVRVQPGHFCAFNKCVRFSSDLRSVSIQGRRPVSVASYRLPENPVISKNAYREIFRLALVQGGINGNR